MQLSSEILQKMTFIKRKPFFQILLKEGGEFFFVGGFVRDSFLNIEAKDVDLLIRKIDIKKLITVLEKFGKVDLVGESFGVIKFKETKTDFECEISLPRKDSKSADNRGHKSIDVQSDPFLSIQDDLIRRDFTINSFAVSHDFEIIDPFFGLKDLKDRLIKATNISAFIEDPLRMLRAIQLASRLGSKLDGETFKLIHLHKHLIKEISPERILIEFQKIIDKKGDWFLFLDLLDATGLWETIFGFKMKKLIGIARPSTISELLFFTVRGENTPVILWGDFFEEKLKIDTKTKKELKALEIINSAFNENLTVSQNRKDMFKALQACPHAFDLPYFEMAGITSKEFTDNLLPSSVNHLDFKGEDFMKLGLEGKRIGDSQKEVVAAIMEGKIKNKKSAILKFLKNTINS